MFTFSKSPYPSIFAICVPLTQRDYFLKSFPFHLIFVRYSLRQTPLFSTNFPSPLLLRFHHYHLSTSSSSLHFNTLSNSFQITPCRQHLFHPPFPISSTSQSNTLFYRTRFFYLMWIFLYHTSKILPTITSSYLSFTHQFPFQLHQNWFSPTSVLTYHLTIPYWSSTLLPSSPLSHQSLSTLKITSYKNNSLFDT